MKAGIIGLVVIILVIGGFLFLKSLKVPADFNNPVPDPKSSSPPSEEKQEVENILTIDSNLAIGSDSSVTPESGSYQDYSDSAFDAASTKKRVLFFFANWCPTCKPLDAELSANTAKIPAGVAIFRVNYNDSDTDAKDKALAQKYGITYQHTFVQVGENGREEIAKWNGGGLDKLISSIK